MQEEKVNLIEKDEDSNDVENNEDISIDIPVSLIRPNNSKSIILYFLLLFLTIQQVISPLLVRYAHRIAEINHTHVTGATIVLVTELIRIIICCSYVFFNSDSILSFKETVLGAFTNNKKEAIKVCIPAIIYVIQNNLYYIALKLLDATIFSITFQLRILTTAILMILILRKVFSKIQWGALFISLMGVICVQISNTQNRKHVESQEFNNEILGLVIVIIMCWTSAFAGVYLESVFKKSACDIWVQNIRLSIITLPFSLLTLANESKILHQNGFFYGWTNLTWVIACNSAIGGVMVAAVMKYADNIKKTYCQSIALGGTALLSVFLGDTKATVLLFSGVSLVILSVVLYTLFPYKETNNKNRVIEIKNPLKIASPNK